MSSVKCSLNTIEEKKSYNIEGQTLRSFIQFDAVQGASAERTQPGQPKNTIFPYRCVTELQKYEAWKLDSERLLYIH